jgi:Mg2+/Co2+ transporter CorB
LSNHNPINLFANNIIEKVLFRLPEIIHCEHGGKLNYIIATVLMALALLVRTRLAPVEADLQCNMQFLSCSYSCVSNRRAVARNLRHCSG